MPELPCPVCGGLVDLGSFLARHRWPSAYPDDVALAIVPCAQGDPLHVRIMTAGGDLVIHLLGAR